MTARVPDGEQPLWITGPAQPLGYPCGVCRGRGGVHMPDCLVRPDGEQPVGGEGPRCVNGHTDAEHWLDGRYSCPTPPRPRPAEPTVEPQLAELDALRAVVARVEALADRYDQLALACDEGPTRVMTRSTADRIRRALDGA